jgi:hypothetical protein
MTALTAEGRSRRTAAANRTRKKKYGFCLSHEAHVRGGQMAMHLRRHQERFSAKCQICLEELLEQQSAFFKKFES